MRPKPPVEWSHLPVARRQRLVALLAQLVKHRLRTVQAGEEKADERVPLALPPPGDVESGRKDPAPPPGSVGRGVCPSIHDATARVSPCSGCETGRPSPPFAFRSATAYGPRFAPLRGHGSGTTRLRHGPYDEWLDGASDALAYGLRWLRDLRPLRHSGHTHAPGAYRGLPASCFALPWWAAND